MALDDSNRPGRSRLTVVLASMLLLGCTSPSENDRLDRAMSDSILVLERSADRSAERWRSWHETHPFRALLEPRPPGVGFREIPGRFEATAYAAPVLEAVPAADEIHRHPIMASPPDSIPASELPTRSEYAADPDLRPPVIGWVANGLDAYLAEVNGSVALRTPEGDLMCLDWVRTNERPYTSLGRRLIEEGHAAAEGLDLGTIRALHRLDPGLVESLMLDNDRVVYFREIPADRWPEASTGVRLIPRHSVAVDPKIIPLGSMVRVERPDGEVMIAMAVDTGGAIRERRIDLFLGVGDEAMAEAGGVVESVRVSIIEPVD